MMQKMCSWLELWTEAVENSLDSHLRNAILCSWEADKNFCLSF